MSLSTLTENVISIAQQLRREDLDLSDGDCIAAATRIVQTDALLDCFGVNGAGAAFLEAIAIQLGYQPNNSAGTISNSLDYIAQSIHGK